MHIQWTSKRRTYIQGISITKLSTTYFNCNRSKCPRVFFDTLKTGLDDSDRANITRAQTYFICHSKLIGVTLQLIDAAPWECKFNKLAVQHQQVRARHQLISVSCVEIIQPFFSVCEGKKLLSWLEIFTGRTMTMRRIKGENPILM